MGSLGEAEGRRRRPRFLSLHGFRTSAEIMRKQVLGKWPADVTARLDLVFADAPFPAEGKSEVEGVFDPPYYEWFQFDKGFMEYRNFDKCLAYIEELMIKDVPFDGLMGFSQGAILSAALTGLQEHGLALTRVPKIKYLIIIGGAKFQSPTVAEKAYANKIACPSLHFIGENDFLKVHGEKLIESCVDPFIIRHPKGHTVPRLGLQCMITTSKTTCRTDSGNGLTRCWWCPAWSPQGARRRRRARTGEREGLLCLHGFRTSGEIMRRQVVGRWPHEVTSRLDLVFADAPFPTEGASPVAGVFDPPYYEWCQFVGEDFLKCRNLDRCFSYLEELMAREGPFDGLLGFSQGAGVSAVLAGLQEQGLALTGFAKLKCVILMAGAKIQSPAAATRAFAGKIMCPSLHFIGDDDFVRIHSQELVESFADPLVIRHPCGHTVPRLDEKGLQVVLGYLDKIERELSDHPATDAEIVTWNSEKKTRKPSVRSLEKFTEFS